MHFALVFGQAAPEQFAGGVRGLMAGAQAGIQRTAAHRPEYAAGAGQGIAALQGQIEFQALVMATGIDIQTRVFGVAGDGGIAAAEGGVFAAGILHAQVPQMCAGFDMHVPQIIAHAVAATEMVFDKGGVAVFAAFDLVAQIAAAGIALAVDEHQMQRRIQHGAFGHFNQQAVFGQRGIERGKRCFGIAELASEHGHGAFVITGQSLGQRADTQGLGAAGVAACGIIAAIHEHQTRRRRQLDADGGNRLAFGKVFPGQCPQGRVFPALEFVVRKADAQRLGQGGLAPGQHARVARRLAAGEYGRLAVEEGRHQAVPACTLA